MYLVDTSIWIDYFRKKNNPGVNYFMTVLDKNIPFGMTGIIFQEILQGSASLQDFQQINEYLGTQRFFHPKDNLKSYKSAAQLYFDCRRKGLTIRSTVDCLIAQIAIEHKLILLHNDKDFKLIKKISPELELYDHS